MESALRGEYIVYVANDWRTDNRTSSHHIVSYLAANNRILYLEAAGQRAPRATSRDMKRIVSRLHKALRRPTEVQPNIWVLSPLIIPFHNYRWVQIVNRWWLKITVARACRRLGFERPIIWLTIPHYAGIIDELPAKGVVYYCTDDFASFPNTNRLAIQNMERKILAKAAVVFAVSEPLFEKQRRVNPHTVLSIHGVDTNHFGKALDPGTKIPLDIGRLRRPIAGFFGLVEAWFDLELLDYCAAEHPDISFVVIGRTASNIDTVAERPNVYFLGDKPYELLPNYLRAFDVGLIPFKNIDTIFYSNPLKFKEYLAGGKPVVSVRIPALEKYEAIAYFAESYQEFARFIRRSIDEDSPEKCRERVSAMTEESWPIKAERVCALVRAHVANAEEGAHRNI